MVYPQPSTLQLWQDKYTLLHEQLVKIQKEGKSIIHRSHQSILYIQEAIDVLDIEAAVYNFQSIEEQILYFKEVRPAFHSQLIFYQRVLHLELNKPPSGVQHQEAYLIAKLTHLDLFFESNKFLYRYLRSGSTHLDEKLFVKNAKFTDLTLEIYGLQEEAIFPVGCDLVVAAIKANELIYQYVTEELEALRNPGDHQRMIKPTLKWTGSKTGLTELAYAIQSAGVVNNGKADLKEIVEQLQAIFQVDLGNYPRTFQEILSRKTGYTNFIDMLRDRLLVRIQAIEDKYIR